MSATLEIVQYLKEMKEDPDLNKNFRIKLDKVILLLQRDAELPLDRALLVLEELNSQEMSSYHRTKVWDVISLLESAKVQHQIE